jgi:dephospho-CoA kinase
MYIVGLTGGIGSGKSTVGKLFSQLGINVVDADTASRKVVEPGTSALTQIAQHFGPESLRKDGSLNRAFLRTQVFEDSQKRQWLEALLHPLIREQVRQEIASSTSAYTILESPLLLETDQCKLTHRILVVDVPEPLQIERASTRDSNNQQQIKAIMASQLSREKRLERADDVIDNSKTPDALVAIVGQLHNTYLALASTHHERT